MGVFTPLGSGRRAVPWSTFLMAVIRKQGHQETFKLGKDASRKPSKLTANGVSPSSSAGLIFARFPGAQAGFSFAIQDVLTGEGIADLDGGRAGHPDST